MELDYRTFFVDIAVEEFDAVEEIIKSYDIESYLIAHEAKNRKGEDKPHFHVLAYTTKINLTNLVKKLKTKYDLTNKAGTHGGKRRFGTSNGGNPIHNKDHYATYLCKDGNVRSTMGDELLKKWMDASFQKEESNVAFDKVVREALVKYPQPDLESPTLYQDITIFNIKTIIKNDLRISLTLSSMKRIYFKYIQSLSSDSFDFDQKSLKIYECIANNKWVYGNPVLNKPLTW